MFNILIISMILSCVTAYSNVYIIVDIRMTNMTKCNFTLNKSDDRSDTIEIGPINCDDYEIGDVVCVYNYHIDTCTENKAGRMAAYVIVAITMAVCISIVVIWVLNLRHNNIAKKRRTRAVITDIYESYENEQCPICIEDMVDNVCRVKCNHMYHRVCIMPWLEINNTCPVCREPLF